MLESLKAAERWSKRELGFDIGFDPFEGKPDESTLCDLRVIPNFFLCLLLK